HTGFNVTSAGFRVKYIPLNLAKGLCPDEVKSFFTQQYRWCMGSFSLMTNPDFWASKLSFMQKANYCSGMLYYLATAVGVFVTPFPTMAMVWLLPEYVVWYSLLFTMPSFIFSSLFLAFWSNHPFGLY